MSVQFIASVPALSGVSSLTGAPFLAAGQSTPTPAPAPASGQEFGSASTLGFVVLVLFFIAVAFLARSMAKHLKRVQKPFEEAARTIDDAADLDPTTDSDVEGSATAGPADSASPDQPAAAPSATEASATAAEAAPKAAGSAPTDAAEQHKADA